MAQQLKKGQSCKASAFALRSPALQYVGLLSNICVADTNLGALFKEQIAF